MPGFFYELGRAAGPRVRRAQWAWQSVFGSEDDIIAAENLVGQDLAAEVLRQVRLCPDEGLTATVSDLGVRLARCLVNQRRHFRFHVIEIPSPNAFALPGGHVFVTRSILDLCQGQPDQMAFVLAHEMAHVVRGHAMDRMVAHSAVSFAAGLASARSAVGAWARQVGVSAIQSVYSQDQELEADRLAVHLIRAAGHDGHAAEQLMLALAGNLSDRGSGGLGTYFGSHPPFHERTAAIRHTLQRPG